MSEEALQKFPRQLHERDLFNSDEYRELCNRSGQMMNRFGMLLCTKETKDFMTGYAGIVRNWMIRTGRR